MKLSPFSPQSASVDPDTGMMTPCESAYRLNLHNTVKRLAEPSTGTGAGSANLGANCPAVDASKPYTWVQVTLPDGSIGHYPVWK